VAKLAKINGKWLTAIKFVLSGALLAILLIQLIRFDEFSPEEVTLRKPSLLFLAILLMPLNWLLEGVKWQLMLRKLGAGIPFAKMIYSLLTGVSASLFTPNRTGNFIGRIIWLPSRIRIEASVLTIFGNSAQWLAAMMFGLVGFFLYNEVSIPELAIWIRISLMVIAGIIVVLYVFPYWLPRKLASFFWKKSLEHAAHVLERNHGLKWQLLGLSLLRHVVFSFQYVFILSAFALPLSLDLFFAVWTIYFLMTLAPSMAFGKLLVRENVAIYVLGAMIPNAAIILSCSLILWFINLSLPALLGGLIWLKWKPGR
jgi:uncharacterized membrane protein YbhN (UPF0104 family)